MIPKLTIGRTNAVYSSANWVYNQVGLQYDAAGTQYGGSDRKDGIGPKQFSIVSNMPKVQGVAVL